MTDSHQQKSKTKGELSTHFDVELLISLHSFNKSSEQTELCKQKYFSRLVIVFTRFTLQSRN